MAFTDGCGLLGSEDTESAGDDETIWEEVCGGGEEGKEGEGGEGGEVEAHCCWDRKMGEKGDGKLDGEWGLGREAGSELYTYKSLDGAGATSFPLHNLRVTHCTQVPPLAVQKCQRSPA